ncbi:uncharacterized protein LOC111869574 [Cryptotermes secundus]|uniref:uncharacterized protein LOC111869574 n=1 Tax=Cryptotermes secundus TaxID=105785 RepID=UPI000CD7AEA4|nr:uncharacterized protein LOC111869574 [Cryptotermes secundus]
MANPELYTVLLLLLALCSAVKTIAPRNAHGEDSDDVTPNKVQTCPAEESSLLGPHGRVVTVTWPESAGTPTDFADDVMDKAGILSEPICLSETLEPLPRWCLKQGSSSRWYPLDPPRCVGGVQMKIEALNNCPAPFKKLEISGDNAKASICILITGPETWSLISFKHGNTVSILDLDETDFKSIVAVLQRYHISSVWLPVRRDQPFGALVNKLPGKRWGTRFQNISNHPFVKVSNAWSLHNDCASLNINDMVTETKNCSTKLPTLCIVVIPTQQKLLNISCPKNYYVARHNIGHSNRSFRLHNNLTNPITWTKASEVCRKKRNGHLMQISSAQDIFMFLEMVKINKPQPGSKCWMGLKRKDGVMNGFTWNSEYSKVRFVNWNSEFAKDGRAMKFGTRGAILTDGTWSLLPDYSTLKCFVCEADADIMDSVLTLNFFPSTKQLRLRVYFPYELWKESIDDKGFKCFTDSRGVLVREVQTTEIWNKEWTIDDIKMLSNFRGKRNESKLSFHVHKKIYQLEYDKKSSGNYWCEGQKIADFEIIKSNTVLITGQENGPTYSLILDVHGNCNNGKDMRKCDPTISDILDRITLNLSDKIPRRKVASLKVMRIINAFSNGTLRFIFHVQSNQGNKTTFLDDYRRTMGIVRRTVERYKDMYTFHSFRSTEVCPQDVTYDESKPLNWKSTLRGSTCVSTELCLEGDGVPVHRKCSGDFIHGARWNKPSGKCINRNISHVTRSLYELALSSTSKNACYYEGLAGEVASLVSNPSLLTTADIYFVSRIMNELAKIKETIPSLTTIIHILNNVQKANGAYVKLSQTYFNSTNILLDSLQRLMERITIGSKYRDDGLLLAITSQIIVQVSDPIMSNVTGLVLLRNENISNSSPMPTHGYKSFEELTIKPLKTNDNNPDFLQNLNNVEVAVWVPEDVIMEYVKGDKNSSWYDHSPDCKNYMFSLLKNTENRPKIVIVVFYDDHIFQNIYKAENSLHFEHSSNGHDSIVVSRVVSVSIPGYSPDLPMPIPIVFRPLVNVSSIHGAKERQCTFWDFTYNSSSASSSLGGWSREGCVYAGNALSDTTKFGNISSLLNVLDVCVCTHLTHFSELLIGVQDRSTTAYGFVERDYHHKKALDIISLMGCSLSLFGVLGIAVTAIVFKSWRQKPGTKILLQLSLALGIQMVIFILSSADIVQSGYEKHPQECTPKSFGLQYYMEADTSVENNIQRPLDIQLLDEKISFSSYDLAVTMRSTMETECPTFEQTITCTIIGALLHYSILAAFAWMLITALLQFFRYVRVLGATRPPRFFLKAMIFGWVVPVIPVLLVLALAPSSYIPPSPESTILCYPSGLPLYFGILLPIGLIVATNLVVYVTIICSIAKIPNRRDICEGSPPLVLQQLRLGFVLFFLLGLSWLFGMMAALGAGFVFSYLFCVSGTVQGFVLFLFFVVCDPSTRNLWTTMLGLWKDTVVRASSNATDFLSSTSTSSISASQKPGPSSLTS